MWQRGKKPTERAILVIPTTNVYWTANFLQFLQNCRITKLRKITIPWWFWRWGHLQNAMLILEQRCMGLWRKACQDESNVSDNAADFSSDRSWLILQSWHWRYKLVASEVHYTRILAYQRNRRMTTSWSWNFFNSGSLSSENFVCHVRQVWENNLEEVKPEWV